MSGSLSPRAKALVEMARGGDDPTAADRARVRRALGAKVALGVGVAVAVTTTTKIASGMAAASAGAAGAGAAGAAGAAGGTAAAGFTVGIGTKLLLSAALVGMVGVGATYVQSVQTETAPLPATSAVATASAVRAAKHEATPRAKARPRAASPAGSASSREEDRDSVTVDPPGEPEAHDSARVEEMPRMVEAKPAVAEGKATPAPRAIEAHATATATVPRDPPPRPAIEAPAPSATPIATNDELALIREVHGALSGGNATRALALLDEHARRFPRGMFGEEREATRVLALCAQGNVQAARTMAEAFLRAFPRSLQADRVRASCAGPF